MGKTRPVIAEGPDRIRIRYDSVSEAAAALGISPPRIVHCCKDFIRFWTKGMDGNVYSFCYEDEVKQYDTVVAIRSDGKEERYQNVNEVCDRLTLEKEKVVFCCDHFPSYWVKSGRNGELYTFCYGVDYAGGGMRISS